MSTDQCDELSRQFVELYLTDKDAAISKLEEESRKQDLNFLLKKTRLSVVKEQFEKQKNNLIQFVKEISFSTRKEQANFIKINYGTKNIKSKICFRLIDSQKLSLEKKEEVDLFIFVARSIDID
jgi:Tfp pilus assembly pilus retraction ATPase PilT